MSMMIGKMKHGMDAARSSPSDLVGLDNIMQDTNLDGHSTPVRQFDAFAESVAETLALMMQKEQTTYKRYDYLTDAPSVTITDRTKIVDWCYSVIDQCEFERETVAIAIEMVDRFLSKASEMSRRVLSSRFQFQLLAMTALYLSIKTYERNVLSIEFFTAISCDQYSVNEIESMELSLLEGLSWNITPPTCVQMAHHILSLVSKLVTIRQTVWAAVLDEVAFQVETAVRDYYFATESPSTVAMAAIFNAIEKIGVQDRQEILNAVLAVTNDELDSPENVIASKDRLYCLVKEGIEDAQSPRM
jgi:hypothetical protein